ncbi:hypothetical protein BS78_10G010800 [Paspalum vaginatum]|nr:hypothetical protein BS78_10G010800 [Paspalum vaginatum]KAJ1257639.1 hypothetical protein BS78_10G010800 [Paspalum vaginatum]
MESTCMKTITMSMLLAMAGPQGWSELPYAVLESIIMMLSGTRDLLAFIATCPSWREAFMSAKARLCKLFPPLMIQSCAQLSNNTPDGEVHHTWQLMDPANPAIRYHRPVPLAGILDKEFVGCSYGHAIFANWGKRRITIVDVFTGADVSPPLLPAAMGISSLVHVSPTIYCALTAPMSLAKECLLVSARHGLFVWRVGSSVWKEHIYASHNAELPIQQIVVFKGKIMAMCPRLIRLCRVHLEGPQLDITIREIPMEWGEDAQNRRRMICDPRLVVCGDRLVLAVSLCVTCPRSRAFFFYYDPSTKPSRWLPASDLDYAVFKGGYVARQMLSSANPGSWGGIRGHVYGPAYYDDDVYQFTSGRLLLSWVTLSVLTWEEEEDDEPKEEEEGRAILPSARRSFRARKPVNRLNL